MNAASLPAAISFVLPAGKRLFLAKPTKQLARHLFTSADTDREFYLVPAVLNGNVWVIFPDTEGHGLLVGDKDGLQSLENYFGDGILDDVKGISRGGIEGDLFLGG